MYQWCCFGNTTSCPDIVCTGGNVPAVIYLLRSYKLMLIGHILVLVTCLTDCRSSSKYYGVDPSAMSMAAIPPSKPTSYCFAQSCVEGYAGSTRNKWDRHTNKHTHTHTHTGLGNYRSGRFLVGKANDDLFNLLPKSDRQPQDRTPILGNVLPDND
jgi:hypothetical protein